MSAREMVEPRFTPASGTSALRAGEYSGLAGVPHEIKKALEALNQP